MKRGRKTKKRAPGAGRKSGSGKSSIKHEWHTQISDKLERGVYESITLLRELIKDYEKRFGSYDRPPGPKNDIETYATEQGNSWLRIANVWQVYLKEHKRAVLRGDPDWFDRQAEALRGRYRSSSADKRQFYKAVFMQLFNRARSYDNPSHPVMLELRKSFAGCTAMSVLESLKKENCGTDRQPDRIKVEGHCFENEKRACEEIREFATQFGFKVVREQGKHRETKRARIAPTLDVHGAIKRLRQTLSTD